MDKGMKRNEKETRDRFVDRLEDDSRPTLVFEVVAPLPIPGLARGGKSFSLELSPFNFHPSEFLLDPWSSPCDNDSYDFNSES